MIYLILSLIIGISAATIIWVIFIIEKDLSPNTLRRLERIKRKSNVTVDKEGAVNFDMPFDYKYKALGDILKNYKITEGIKQLIKLSGTKLHIDTFILFSLFCALVPLFFLLTKIKLVALVSVFTVFIPTIYLKSLINKRFFDFSKQFPDALNLMASSLRAGHPLFAAMNMVAEEMPQPISEVFGTAQKDMSLGIDTKDAFFSMTKIMPKSIDLRFFITAVLIQKDVGGNLAELFDSLSDTIRERFKLMGQLRVQTAQTRLSGMVIGVVPVLVMLVIFFMNPEYIKPLFNTPDGKMAFAIAVGLTILGFASIKKISDIEI